MVYDIIPLIALTPPCLYHEILNSLLTFLATAAIAGTSSPAAVAAPVRQLEPMFVTVPPRPQRLLHSEAYIK